MNWKSIPVTFDGCYINAGPIDTERDGEKVQVSYHTGQITNLQELYDEVDNIAVWEQFDV